MYFQEKSQFIFRRKSELMKRQPWILDERKFISVKEIRKIKRSLNERRNHESAIRDLFVFDIGLNTGLRVSEIADLQVRDLGIDGEMCFVVVRSGKGGKQRVVRISRMLRNRISDFLKWKRSLGEPVGKNDALFFSKRTGLAMSTRALQKAFKRCLKTAGISEAKYSIHCLRHTYASLLYKSSGYNLRLVQRQLGHTSINTTEVYAKVLNPDIDKAVERLSKTFE